MVVLFCELEVEIEIPTQFVGVGTDRSANNYGSEPGVSGEITY